MSFNIFENIGFIFLPCVYSNLELINLGVKLKVVKVA